uniref:CSON000033 protein n=1 Tax=Culicoides sonorensis TaxID=179676 RepID=A0A336KUM1_CULSO
MVAGIADTSLCTQFLIAFGIPTADGGITYPDLSPFKRLRTPNSKLLLAIGGADKVSDKNFPLLAANHRGGFAQNCLNIIRNEGLDGVDIDWEYPKEDTQNKTNFVLLMQELRNKLGSNYILSTAVATGAWRVEKSYDIPALTPLVNYFNLMAYDFHADDGSWDLDWSVPGETKPHYGVYFNAPVNGPGDTVESGIKLFRETFNVPANKLNLGVPFYARVYKLKNAWNTAPKSECYLDNQENFKDTYMPSYNDYCAALTNSAYTKVRDPTTLAPYMYNSSGFWISYEDQRSITVKANLANKYELGGVMLWALNQDDFDGSCGNYCQWSLLKTLNYVVGRKTSYCYGPPQRTTCPSAGYFADPTDCRKAYVCNGAGQAPIQGWCNEPFFFSEAGQNCVPECQAKFTN